MKLISPRQFVNLQIAAEAILANKVRSLLTALGIIFGVGAVIAMLAVGNGAQQEILEQIKLVGVNNIVITPITEQREGKAEEQQQEEQKTKNQFSPGLTMLDMESIKAVVPNITHISPEIVIETNVVYGGIKRSAKLVGVEPAYFEIFNFELETGRMFNQQHTRLGMPVCIIGRGVQAKFFPSQNPIGKYIKCGPHWLQVIGVLENRSVSSGSLQKLGIRDVNMDVYTPLKTTLMRYRNRALVTRSAVERAANERNNNNNEEPAEKKQDNYHQLDRLVVQVSATATLSSSADVIARMLERRHYQVVDYEISIPELLLKQQQRTKDIFNIVLGAIAGISLVVGGIGIMNIMLASVLERIKEIGLRLSLGATKTDIITQFLFEAVMISLSGGLVGVILGVSMALLISGVADIPTIISFGSIALSFGVAAGVGLVFGIAPARRAAQQDPITCLRYE